SISNVPIVHKNVCRQCVRDTESIRRHMLEHLSRRSMATDTRCGETRITVKFYQLDLGGTIMDLAERLAAIEEIKALKARYFRCMDEKDWPGLQAVFTPDVVCDFRDSTGTRDESLLTHGAALYVKNLAPI